MNRLSTEKRAQIVGCLVEGMSIRATCRVTEAAKNTVTKLLVDLGAACSAYMAVEGAFGSEIDYATIVKLYGPDPSGDKRYSPAECLGVERHVVMGDPDPSLISTSFVERQNITMRMGMRRFTRLTNAFSKKVENLAAAVALHFMHYNFARPHKSLANPYPRTPAMAAGVADHAWTLLEIAALGPD